MQYARRTRSMGSGERYMISVVHTHSSIIIGLRALASEPHEGTTDGWAALLVSLASRLNLGGGPE